MHETQSDAFVLADFAAGRGGSPQKMR